MKMEKLKASAKRLYTIVNILRILVIVGAVVLAAAFVGMLFIPAELIEGKAVSTSISIGELTLRLAESAGITALSKNALMITMAGAAVVLAFTLYGIRAVRTILKPMMEGRPFDESTAAGFGKLGNAVLAGGLIAAAVSYYSQAMVMKMIDYQKLFNMDVVNGIELHYSFSITFILAALALYLMSYVFRYGSELQRESDETL